MPNVLVIAPHPDDETLGCGGTIKNRSLAGDSVSLCIVTKTYLPEWPARFAKKRRKEVREVQDILGIEKVFFLDFPTVKLDTIPQKSINDAIGSVVSQVKPEEVYIPHIGDLNMDHQIVHRSALVALRPTRDTSVRRVLSYEVLSETEWGTEPFLPTVYEGIGSTIDWKIGAMKVYEDELRAYPHPRSLAMIKVLAKKRGSEVCLSFAEAFHLIREVH